eukprot:6185594-Pleurochrysis_carterae.AAC.3
MLLLRVAFACCGSRAPGSFRGRAIAQLDFKADVLSMAVSRLVDPEKPSKPPAHKQLLVRPPLHAAASRCTPLHAAARRCTRIQTRSEHGLGSKDVWFASYPCVGEGARSIVEMSLCHGQQRSRVEYC